MRRWLLSLVVLGMGLSPLPALAQEQLAAPTVVNLTGTGPFTLAWDYADPGGPVTFTVYLDNVLVASGLVDATRTYALTVAVPGVHTVGVSASRAGLESPKGTVSIATTPVSPPNVPVTPVISDPSCLPPLGAHAPAIFITKLDQTTGRPGSKSRLDFQIAGLDRMVAVSVRIDGADVIGMTGTDLSALAGAWFTVPPSGTHAVSVRVLNAWGCELVRNWPTPLVVP